MRRFEFSLESVLKIRKKALEDERIALASIINTLNVQNDVLDRMLSDLSELNNQSQKYNSQSEFNPAIANNFYSYICKLSEDIKMQEKIIERTKLDLLNQQKKTQNAYIGVKTLEKLKEKQKEQYDKEFLSDEIKQLDDIVNSRRITA